MMKIAATLLFATQVYLTFRGVNHFGKYINPALLLIVSCIIPLIYIQAITGKVPLTNKSRSKWAYPVLFLLAVAAFGYIAYLYHAGFKQYHNPVEYSDVIPQLEYLWERFARGEQPYYVMDLPHSKPFPVYMPAHWLPVGIAKLFQADLRWVGLVMLFIAILALAFENTRKNKSVLNICFSALLLPSLLYCFFVWGAGDLFVSFETPVAAYYLLLALGLMRRSVVISILGLTLCLLSRYTLVFWLPLFALILLQERTLKQNLIAWSAVFATIMLVYFIPFIARQPDILTTGLAYHNYAAAFEWGFGAWTMEHGIYFAQHFKDLFSGSMEQRVFYTRVIQGSLMILLNIGGWLAYRKWRERINFFDYSLVTLYIFLVYFYSFGPLTYRYYLITTLLLSGLLCLNIISTKTSSPEQIKAH